MTLAIKDLLIKTKMHEPMVISSLMLSNFKLSKHGSDLLQYKTLLSTGLLLVHFSMSLLLILSWLSTRYCQFMDSI